MAHALDITGEIGMANNGTLAILTTIGNHEIIWKIILEDNMITVCLTDANEMSDDELNNCTIVDEISINDSIEARVGIAGMLRERCNFREEQIESFKQAIHHYWKAFGLDRPMELKALLVVMYALEVLDEDRA